MPKKILAALVLASITPAIFAGPSEQAIEQSIRKGVAPLLKDLPIERVIRTTHADLYELLTPAGIVYTDRKGSFVIFNSALVDTKTKANLTEQRLNELSQFNFADLPFQDAIKSVRGNGSRKIVTFEDPNCGYCKKLQQEFQKLDDVTVYTFLTPILSEDSSAKSAAIWCASDRTQAWQTAMAGDGSIPAKKPGCETPLTRNLALYKRLHLRGTPAILFASNTKVTGYMGADALKERLEKAH